MRENKYFFWLIVFIFSISGFTGLVYESIWSHYLKLFLGHAAYAQALVLTIFMGGMAVGSWYVAKKSEQQSNLLKLYAIVEGIIGLFGLVFHSIFEFIIEFSHSSVFPILSPELVHFYKWTIGGLLILPQSFLLGTTFPLMSGGLLRRYQHDSGKTISLLYFSNSIGAAIGVLISGFILIKLVGLPGTILSAAIINILLAIIVYGISKQTNEIIHFKANNNLTNLVPKYILIASLFTGAASFIYEIVWIRMLSMVLGSSTHSFELMLSAFITGLALGGLWIRNRIEKIQNPLRFAANIQIVMGILAMLTIPLYNYTYEIMSSVLSGLARSAIGYNLFSLTSHFICLIVMLPATICAGMTFPLFTSILLKNNYGEKSIGYVYGANTIGSISGVFLTVFILMPYLGLKNSIILGGIIDILIGLFLISIIPINRKVLLKTATVALIFTICIFSMSEVDKSRLMSGVYRTGLAKLESGQDILYHKDGKTASISVAKIDKDIVTISTNGKPDASINMNPDNTDPTRDEITMVMAGAIPISMNPNISQVANIGMGSGLTSNILLGNPSIEQLDTIEIESAMVEGAKHFLPNVKRVYEDERSDIYIEDAKTFFSINQKHYDLIVSEPSNPWVSGTASLFTEEFYRTIKNYLTENGILVQWIQVYELNIDLIFSVLKALNKHFPYFDIYTTDDTNILIVARTHNTDYKLNSNIFNNEILKKELSHVGINSLQDFNARYLGNHLILSNYIKKHKIPSNSDYFPILDTNAERSRFMALDGSSFTNYRIMPFPLINFFSKNLNHNNETIVVANKHHSVTNHIKNAKLIHDALTSKNPDNPFLMDNTIYILNKLRNSCHDTMSEKIWLNAVHTVMTKTIQYLQSHEITNIIDTMRSACNSDDISRSMSDWLSLYYFIANQDIEKIRLLSSSLLTAGDNNIAQKQFLFFSNVISNILQNNHEEALKIWNTHLNELFGGKELAFELTLLYSMIDQ